MAFKFYKSETITTPNGEEYEVLPITVEDMPIVLDIIEIQKKTAKLRKGREKDKTDQIQMIQTRDLFPMAMKIAQRGVKRSDPDNKDKNIDELDKIPDVPMGMTFAVNLATKMIEVSMELDGLDIKKEVADLKEPVEKS